MGESKAKGIETYLGIFTDIQTYSGIIKHIWELFRHILANTGLCVTLACHKLTESVYSCTLGYSEAEVYLQPSQYSHSIWYIQNPRHSPIYTMECFAKIIYGGYNYFGNISFSRSMNIFNKMF